MNNDTDILAAHPWCQTHTETIGRDGLVPATRIDPFGRPQCDSCYHTGETLRNGSFTFYGQFEHWSETPSS